MATQAETFGSAGGCSISPLEQQQCATELRAAQSPDLYTSTQAAEDLYQLITNYPVAKSKVIIYGASYGTLWLSRLTQLYPNIADGYIFDSVVNPSSTTPFDFSSWVRIWLGRRAWC